MGDTAAVDRAKVRRIARIALLVFAGIVSLLCVLLVIGSFRDDAAIESRMGRVTAEVVSVSFSRTLVRFETPDGAAHIPAEGVQYPQGLEPGQLVQVEYDSDNPDLVRVAGRDATLSLLPAGSVLVITWVVVLPVVWWLRRGAPLPRRQEM